MIRDGTSEGYIGVYQVESLDDGLSWSEVREITPSVKKAHWRWYTVGPAGAIRLRYNDRFPGRIIVPANHSVDAGSDNDYLGAHVIYSDDEGASWKVGAVDSEGQSTVNPNETTVVELKDGTLYFNTRNHSSTDTIANRAITYSRDGGLHFTAPFAHEPQLTTPVVHASLTRNRNTLFFFAPFDRKDRIDLSMWKSKDEGRSWTYDRLIYKGASAYSSVCLMAENMLGLLLEADGYDKILYNRIMVK
jgi:sialidase-1